MAELRAIVGSVVDRFCLEPLTPREPRLDNRMTIAPAPGTTRVRLRSPAS